MIRNAPSAGETGTEESRPQGSVAELSRTERENEELRGTFDVIADPIFVKDEDHRFVDVNAAFCRMSGFSREELLGRRPDDVFPKEEADRFRASDELVFTRGESITEEAFLDRDGARHQVLVRKALRVGRDGRRRIVGVVHDATERWRADALRSALYEIAEAATSAEDLDAFYVALHRIVASLMYASNFYIAIHEEERGVLTFPYFVDEIEEHVDEIPAGRGLTWHVIETGQPFYVSSTERPRLAELGVVTIGVPSVHWLGVPLRTTGRAFGALVVQSYHDEHPFSQREREILGFVGRHVATALERRRAQEAIRAMASQYRIVFDSNPQPTFVRDLETQRFLDVNDVAVSRYGFTREEFLSMTMDDLRPNDDVSTHPGGPSRVAAGALDAAGAWRHRRKDGSVIEVDTTSHALTFGGRAAELVMATDVTEKRSLEEQLRQSQKMDAVGKLAGGIAHDFNNLLTTILGYSDLLLSHYPVDTPAREYVLEVRTAGERAASLTRRLLAFSRKQVIEPRVLELDTLIAEASRMLRPLIGEDVELVLKTDPRLGRVRADPGQVEQVLMNLVLNARDAMPGGGRIVVETRDVELTPEDAREHLDVAPGSYVRITVTDTGTGIDAETLRHIFEPFFTTKPKGKGTGLGLSVVYGIVKQSGGYVWAESAPGKGTTFSVYLPRVDAVEEEGRMTASGSRPIVRGRETVLVVEDEEKIRALMRDILVAAGYRVLEAPDGERALSLASEHAGEIELVVSDVVMPKMNGPEFVQRLMSRRPDLRVLFTSGYTDDALTAHDILMSGAELLKKPFKPSELLARVRGVLSAPEE